MLSKEVFNMLVLKSFKVMGIGVGLGAIFFFLWPARWAENLNKVMNRWISTRQMTRGLDTMINIDSKIMKGRIVLGVISLITSIALFYLYFKYKPL